MLRKFHEVHDMFVALLVSLFRINAPPPTMRATFERTGELQQLCDELIRKAHNEKGGKLTAGKKGVLHDENGRTVRAFAFEFGRFVVDRTLYIGLVIDMLIDEVHLLLIRSDVTSPPYTLFPDIGTSQDWKVLQKCVDRFSPKSSTHRYVVDMQSAQHTAAENAVARHLEMSGTFQKRDLDTLQNMENSKLHLLDLSSIVALAHAFLFQLFPRFIHVLVADGADDLEEVRRVFKALDFTTEGYLSGLYVPSISVSGKKSLDLWRKNSRFSYIVYENPKNIDCLFCEVEQAIALDDHQFHDRFPYPPVVVGPNIWSKQSCVEIDVRGLRFSDEELLAARKYVASLLKHHAQFMGKFSACWAESVSAQDAAITPYVQLWYRSFHFAVGTTLFPASNALMDYLELARGADAARLRLRSDRKQRYEKAIAKFRSATSESPWLYPSKPCTKAEALALLSEDYDAFLHQKDGRPVLAFTEASLIRCTRLEQQEVDDFVSKLKENHLLTNKTHPVTFKNREQRRFICITANELTITGETENEGAE